MLPIIVDTLPMSFAEYKALNWALLRKTRKTLFIAPFIGIGFVGISLLLNSAPRTGGPDMFAIITFGLGVLFFASFSVFSLNRNIKKNYLNTPALAGGMRITLAENSITQQSTSSFSENPWPASFKKATCLGRWLLLPSGPASAYFLDTDRVEAPATLADLQALLQRKGVAIKA